MKASINIPPVFSTRAISGSRVVLSAEPQARRAVTISRQALEALVEYGYCELFLPKHPSANRSLGVYIRWAKPQAIAAFFKEHKLQ